MMTRAAPMVGVLIGALVCGASCGDDTSSDDAAADNTATAGDAGNGADGGNAVTTAANDGTGNAVTTSAPQSDTTVDDSGGDDGSTTGATQVPPCPYTAVDGEPSVAIEEIATGFEFPVMALGEPTQPDRLYVVDRVGTIKILEPGDTEAPEDSFLEVDVTGNQANRGTELGLLGFDFHPNFPDDPRVYIAYNPQGVSVTQVDEFVVGGDGNVDVTTRRTVIAADQPQGNHNGGMIAFGPDGYLYFGLGDGGDQENTYLTGGDPSVILAKLLRIGVEPDQEIDAPISCIHPACETTGEFDYTIPPDNPFVDTKGYAPEIYALGLRNPWRFSFDPDNGDLYLADVGQLSYEEVDLIEAGHDYGWVRMEGFHCFLPDGDCSDEGLAPNTENAQGWTAPLVEYGRGVGQSVTGLSVYRSCEVPAWNGIYFYGDYGSSILRALVWDGETVTDLGTVAILGMTRRVFGGGWNAWGDVYVTTSNDLGDGRVYRIAPGK